MVNVGGLGWQQFTAQECRDGNSTVKHTETATPALSEDMLIYNRLRWIHITRRGAARSDAARQNILTWI